MDWFRNTTKLVTYSCNIFRLGNAMMQYWNLRAYAFLSGLDFNMTANRSDIVSHLPAEVRAERAPSEIQRRLWSKMREEACTDCPFPHGNAHAPWRIFGETILNDTSAVVARVLKESSDRTRRYTNWTARKDWAVIHYRCDWTVWRNEQYGYFRHSFFKERLPSSTTHVLIVGQVHSADPLCKSIMDDLVNWLKEDRGLAVVFQQTNQQDDWLTMATAPLLFCSSSTYCLSAGMGNPHTVYYPVSGMNLAVVEDGPEMAEAALTRPPGFHFVRSDYVPGPAAADQTFKELQAYFGADRCDEEVHKCVPVDGRIPAKYQLHPWRDM